MEGSATKRRKYSDSFDEENVEFSPKLMLQSSYYPSNSKATDERENSDSGFAETDLSRTSESTGDGHREGVSLMDQYSDETIRDCAFPAGNSNTPNVPEEDEDYDEEDDDNFSSMSGISGFSVMSDDEDPFSAAWIRQKIVDGVSARDLLSKLCPQGMVIQGASEITLWRMIASTMAQPRVRKRLQEYGTLEHAAELIQRSQNIIVLTGAGVSVSCGIPDFRSRDGIYSRLSKEYPDLPDPQAMFEIRYFYNDPRPFYKFAREIYPGQYQPSISHQFVKLLESKGKLLRNYTQNIDTLESVAGIQNLIECHGSFASASCTKCKARSDAEQIREDILNQKIPICQVCNPGAESPVSAELSIESTRQLVDKGIMKPDIVFFGEGLPDVFHDTLDSDRHKCDLLIVIGSSLKVRPVSTIPHSIEANVPQILINREPLYHLDTFDINLFGDSDVIFQHLCSMIGESWKLTENVPNLTECKELLPSPPKVPEPVKAAIHEEPSSSTQEPNVSESPERHNKISLSDRLPPDTYYKLSPRYYVFQGAEVYPHSEDEDEEYEEDAEDSDIDKKYDEQSLPPEPNYGEHLP